MKLIYGMRTDVGKVRKVNEDAYAVAQPGDLLQYALVCDGMGGHQAGDVASSIVVRTVQEKLVEYDAFTPKILREIAQASNEKVFEHAIRHENCKGMGTTMIFAAFVDSNIYLLNVGDSRAYLYDREWNEFHQLSRDHSLVEEMLQSKQLSPGQVDNFPYRNVITRAIGTMQVVSPDVFEREWKRGDSLLLCTDGLTNTVSKEQLGEVLGGKEPPQEKCDMLIDLANRGGGIDNITAVIIQNEMWGD